MGTTEEALRVTELFERVFDHLIQKFNCQLLELGEVFTEVGDDTDWHRTRKGYMKYSKAAMLTLNGKVWLLAYGINGGGYPADAYQADLTALPFVLGEKTAEQIVAEAKGSLRFFSIYFCNSLLIGLYTGQLAAPGEGLHRGIETRFSKKVLELIGPRVNEFVAQQLEFRDDMFFIDLRRIPSSTQRYKPEFIPVIAEAIERVLASS